MIRTIVLLVALFTFYAASAQFNDSTFYHLSANATGAFTKTDAASNYLLNNSLKFSIRRKDIRLNNNNSWIYGQQQKTLVNNDYSSTFDFNLYKTLPHFFYWGLANYTSSYSLKINNQAQLGAGIAYNILDREKAVVNISDGILYEYSDLNLGDTARDVYTTFRNSLRLQFRFNITTVVSINSSSFLQNSLNYGDDYIIRSSNSLSVKLKRWISLSAGLTYNRVSRTQKENLLVNYGVLLEKYF